MYERMYDMGCGVRSNALDSQSLRDSYSGGPARLIKYTRKYDDKKGVSNALDPQSLRDSYSGGPAHIKLHQTITLDRIL